MTDKNDLVYFESCNTSWCFDRQRLRFRRIPRRSSRQATNADFTVAAWEDYFALDLDDASGAFTVVLNEEESKLLRSWKHSENCSHCGDGASSHTEEISFSQLNDLLGGP